MVSSNTETGIAVTYDDSDNTLDFVLPAAATITTSLGVGGGSSNGVQISQGAIAIKNGGAKSYIDLYCFLKKTPELSVNYISMSNH